MLEKTENGRLYTYAGCMFSGKTDRLIREIDRENIKESKIITFKPGIDDRHGEKYIGTHSGSKRQARIIEKDNEDKILEKVDSSYDVVFLDDANLMSDKIVNVIRALIEKGVDVHVAATDKDFKGDPFKPVPKILALADQVEKLFAICEICGSQATMSQRLVDGKPAKEDDPIIKIDSEETYEPRCRDCHVVK